MSKHQLAAAVMAFFLMLVAGCATTKPTAKLHHSINSEEKFPKLKQIVLLPVDIDIYELSLGGVKEEVPEWSDTAERNIHSALLFSKDEKSSGAVHRAVNSSDLTEEEQDILDEHLALFSSVAGSAIWATSELNPAWNFKQEHFDYTIGDGLRFLKTKYDIDAGLFIIGEETISTSGRQAAAVLGAILLGAYIPTGNSILIGGLVDFNTGNLLWMDYKVAGGTINLKDLESCKEFVSKLVDGYPVDIKEIPSSQ